MMHLPVDLPAPLLNLYESHAQFFTDAMTTQRVKHQYFVYLESLQQCNTSNPYDELLQQALRDIPEQNPVQSHLEKLILEGCAQGLYEHAYHLTSIPYSNIRSALFLFFKAHIPTRPGSDNMTEIADPQFVKKLINNQFKQPHPYLLGQQRTPELIHEVVMHCSGRAIDHFREMLRMQG